MAAVFSLCGNGSRLWRKPSFRKLFLQRPRNFHCQRNRFAQKKSGEKFVEQEVMEQWPEGYSRMGQIIRPLVFTIMTGVVAFTGCSIIQYERVRNSYIGNKESRMAGLLKMFNMDVIVNWWHSLPEGRKTAAGIIALNTAVFLLWRIPHPRINLFMWKWFVSSPFSSTVTLLTSCFSHMDIFHLSLNMIVLWSFAPPLQALMGREQFLAFYITGGVFSTFISHAFSVATLRSVFVGSLGASGALFAALAVLCIQHPDSRLAIIFLPFITFPAGKFFLAVVALDLAGVVLRWQKFNHVAHLGGALFGAWYLKYGSYSFQDYRQWALLKWHKLRGGT